MSDYPRLCEIKNFGEFLEKCLKQKIQSYSFRSLTKPGDNYGSVMHAVDIKLNENADANEVITEKK